MQPNPQKHPNIHKHTPQPTQTGLDLKIMEDPVGFFTLAVDWAAFLWRWGLRKLTELGLHPYPVEGRPPPAMAGASAGGRKYD